MVYYTVRCDPLPGKEEEFDHFAINDARNFWLGQTGVKSYHVFGDKLMGWPERTIMIEVDDFATLQRILDSDGRKKVRKQAVSLLTRAEAQILDVVC